jgi:hypothetical protein
MNDYKSWPVCFGLVIWISATACGGAEQEVLRRFFRATMNEDTNTVAALSLVSFPGGAVESWDVVEVEPTTREPFKLSELRSRAETAKIERDAQFAVFSDFRLANYSDLLLIEERLEQNPDYPFRGKLAHLHAKYQSYRKERAVLELALREIKRAMEDEKKPARKSVMTSDDIELFAGEVLTRKVVVDVESASDLLAAYVFTLRKYDLTNLQNDFTPPSRWIIVSIQEASG